MCKWLCIIALFSNWGTPFYSQGENKVFENYTHVCMHKTRGFKNERQNNESRLGKYKKYIHITVRVSSQKRDLFGTGAI